MDKKRKSLRRSSAQLPNSPNPEPSAPIPSSTGPSSITANLASNTSNSSGSNGAPKLEDSSSSAMSTVASASSAIIKSGEKRAEPDSGGPQLQQHAAAQVKRLRRSLGDGAGAGAGVALLLSGRVWDYLDELDSRLANSAGPLPPPPGPRPLASSMSGSLAAVSSVAAPPAGNLWSRLGSARSRVLADAPGASGPRALLDHPDAAPELKVSLVLHLYPHGFALNHQQLAFPYGARAHKDLLRQIDRGRLPLALLELLMGDPAQPALHFYDGCLLAELRDHRAPAVPGAAPVRRVLLRTGGDARAAELDLLAAEHDWGADELLAAEARLLLAHVPASELCLAPAPAVALLAQAVAADTARLAVPRALALASPAFSTDRANPLVLPTTSFPLLKFLLQHPTPPAYVYASTSAAVPADHPPATTAPASASTPAGAASAAGVAAGSSVPVPVSEEGLGRVRSALAAAPAKAPGIAPRILRLQKNAARVYWLLELVPRPPAVELALRSAVYTQDPSAGAPPYEVVRAQLGNTPTTARLLRKMLHVFEREGYHITFDSANPATVDGAVAAGAAATGGAPPAPAASLPGAPAAVPFAPSTPSTSAATPASTAAGPTPGTFASPPPYAQGGAKPAPPAAPPAVASTPTSPSTRNQRKAQAKKPPAPLPQPVSQTAAPAPQATPPVGAARGTTGVPAVVQLVSAQHAINQRQAAEIAAAHAAHQAASRGRGTGQAPVPTPAPAAGGFKAAASPAAPPAAGRPAYPPATPFPATYAKPASK